MSRTVAKRGTGNLPVWQGEEGKGKECLRRLKAEGLKNPISGFAGEVVSESLPCAGTDCSLAPAVPGNG